MPANIPPGISGFIVLLAGCGLSQRALARNTGVSQGIISKVLCHVWETGRAMQRPRGHKLRMATPREDCVLLWILRRNSFLSSSRIRVDLIRRHRSSACMVQRRLVTAWYCSRRPPICPRLDHDHCCRRSIWAGRHENWNHQHWFDVIFAHESRFSLYNSDGRTRVPQCVS